MNPVGNFYFVTTNEKDSLPSIFERMPERSSIFDMIGPIMIGPSSSHTGAVVRIGRIARHLLGSPPEQAEVIFYNSFSRTYEGHGSDRAVLAGLLDMKPDDERIKTAPDHAKEAGMKYHFKAVHNATHLHPNAIRITASSGEKEISLLGISRGGGLIAIKQVDGYSCNFSAQSHTLLILAQDTEGSIAFISSVLTNEGCNIATMTVDRSGKRGLAKLVFELDAAIRPLTLQYLKSLHWVEEVVYLDKVEE